MVDQRLRSVDILRRGYGRRYTWLPIDQLDQDGFGVNFQDMYTRPEQIDIRVDDIARWRDGENFFEARVAEVRRELDWLYVRFADTQRISVSLYYS